MVNPKAGRCEKMKIFLMLRFLEGEKLYRQYLYLASCWSKKRKPGNYAHDRRHKFGKKDEINNVRYMDPELADQLMNAGDNDDIMGGKQSVGTVLFSDVRSFTTITEELGAQGTVKLLNEYFTIMVDCITDEGGMLG